MVGEGVDLCLPRNRQTLVVTLILSRHQASLCLSVNNMLNLEQLYNLVRRRVSASSISRSCYSFNTFKSRLNSVPYVRACEKTRLVHKKCATVIDNLIKFHNYAIDFVCQTRLSPSHSASTPFVSPTVV